MKKTISILLIVAMLASCLSGCGDTQLDAVSFDTDAKSSKYKHINNGGVEDKDGLPYNVDAITGATLTVEGPAVEASVPLSVREIENQKEGIARGQYKDSKGVYTYEGIDVYYLVHNMSSGAGGIALTDTAYDIVFKNANREEISRLTLKEIEDAHNSSRPVILAYGIGTKDESSVVPFVFDGADKNTHSLGYDSKLKNDDGCIKLVYDNENYGSGNYKTFSNTAYVYVCEETVPGFKHSGTPVDSYGSSRYMDTILTFRGDALGREFDLTTKQLEDLVSYDANGNVVSGGIGYSDWYSLANNAYWYVNEYEGLQLYELLQYLGLPSAEEMGTKMARTTIVNFIAADGAESNEEFSIDTLSYPDAFGFYKKNAQDPGDGTYTPTNADLVKLGYPVLLSYGVNDYPYTILKTDDAYVSGLSNSGGPFRVVFGKTTYAHANGSNQVQQLSEIIVGDDVLYNTHKYSDDSAMNKLAEETVKVCVKDSNGKVLFDKDITVGEIEAAIYGEDVKPQDKSNAKVKDSYELSSEVNVFEGIDAEYFFMNLLKLPGKNGIVTIKGDKEVSLSLEQIFQEGYNSKLQRSGLKSIFAFAKNGSAMVESASSTGYEKEVALKPFLDSDPKTYAVDNQGGPLMLVVPSTGLGTADGKSVANVKEISIELVPDSYAHIDAKYSKYQNSSVKFYGPGLEKEKVYKVSELEGKQTLAETVDYSMLNNAGTLTEERYRGIPIYELFKEIGVNNNAGEVTVYCKDGTSKTYSLISLKKTYENFVNSDKKAAAAMLAFGLGDINGDKMQGTPLTDAGPLMLVVPQESKDSVNKSLCLKNVTAVYVSANEIKNWGHAMSDVYSEYLDYEFTVTFKNDENEASVVYTVAELEAMDEIRVRDNYTVLDMGECEGVDLWKLVLKAAGGKLDLSNPIAVTVVAEDGFSCDLLSKVYMEGLINGVESENGDTRKVILSNAQNGYPLVHDANHEGYTGMAGGAGGNAFGPVRTVVETAQGASLKCTNQIVVTLSGSDPININ